MSVEVRVDEGEVQEVLEWAEEHGNAHHTDHPDGTYEEGVSDAIRWMLGYISTRPDEA